MRHGQQRLGHRAKLGLCETWLVLDNLSKLEQRFQQAARSPQNQIRALFTKHDVGHNRLTYVGADSSDKDSARANAAAQEQFAFNCNGSPVT